MTYFVYLIININKKATQAVSYVGYTNNLKKRLWLHNISKGAKFTKGKNWKLAYSKKYKNKSIALKEEHKLKKNFKLRNEIKKNFLKYENFSITSL